MLRVGIVGIGFMGMIHYLSYARVRGTKVVALCEQDEKRLAGDWRAIKGNFGPRGQLMDLTGIARYRDLNELVNDPKVDLIDICLPPAVHPSATLAALKAGKHVFCEKPIALSTTDAEKMVTAAGKAKRFLQVGHVLSFFPEYAYARKAIESGRYGKLLGGHFRRVISDPLWIKDFYDPKRIGGPLLDLHVHDAHFIRLVFGMPKAVSSRGRMRGEVVQFVESQFMFDDHSLVVSATSGAIDQQGRSFNHGFEIHLERATVLFEFAVLCGEPHVATPLTVLDNKGGAIQPKLGSGDPTEAFVAEIQEVCKSIERGQVSPILDGILARDAVQICLKEAQSVRSGRLVRI